MIRKLFIPLVIFVLPLTVCAQNEVSKLIQAGNDFYFGNAYALAETEYRKALELSPGNATARFNLATALARQEKKDESLTIFTELAEKESDMALRAKAWYNKGVAHTNEKKDAETGGKAAEETVIRKLQESIESYKSALRLDPADNEARENLQKALAELKKKQPKEDKKKKNQKQQPKKQQAKMSPKEAEQKLKLLEEKEKQAQQRLQKSKTTGGSQPKDW